MMKSAISCFPLCLTVGEVRVSLPDMDREVKGQYEVVIQAKDMAGQLGGLAGTTTVNITLSDVNDNPPHFPQSENLSTINSNNQRHSYHPDVDCFPLTAILVLCYHSLSTVYKKVVLYIYSYSTYICKTP